ncbi:outer membrane protein assembly factor BamB [Glaciecola siphonariae]|uniref:Outer membrane protein assembly factor BamB n=1 Tax=Glaciecola siphonariae TaxID=521012 RepID=A0ABV9LZ76_9ALTE
MNNSVKILALALLLSGCTTVTNWFSDEEEIAIRTLPEIEMAFETETVWQQDVGDGIDNYFSRLSPAVGYGKVFAADREGTIVALSPQTGKEIWELDISTRSTRSYIGNLYGLFPAKVSAKVAGGITLGYQRLYIGTENGEVLAINEADGSIAWRTKVPSEVLAAPAIDSGIVVVNTVAGTLVGLDANTGELKWVNESDVPPLSLRGVSAPAAANGGAIVGQASGRLQVSIIDTGLTAWEQVIAKPAGATELERIVDVDSKPLVFGGTVYVVSYGGTLSAVELRTGQVVWSREYGSYRNISIFGNRLFVTDNNSNVYAIDRRNGVELWSSGELRRRNLTEPTPVGDYLVVGDKFGFLHWFTQDEGKYVSRMEVGDDDEDEGIYTAPVYQDNILVVQTRDGVVSVISTP